VLGVNQDKYDAAKHNIISNASCTTNCLAPVVKGDPGNVRHRLRHHDHHPQLHTIRSSWTRRTRTCRRARAAALSMIPTSTGAAKALKLVIPESSGKLDGFAIRVPTPNVSIVDLTFIAEKPITAEALNAAFKKASEGELRAFWATTPTFWSAPTSRAMRAAQSLTRL